MKSKKPKSARAEAPVSRTWWWCGGALAALAVVFWAYGPAMRTGFLFDDTTQQFALPSASGPLSSWIGVVRPVLMFSYWVNSRISMEDTSWYHCFNILIHALAGQGASSEARGEAEQTVNHHSDSDWVREVERFTGAHRHRNIRVNDAGELVSY